MSIHIVAMENAYNALREKRDSIRNGRKRNELSKEERKRFERIEERMSILADEIILEYEIIGEIKN